MNTHNRKWLPWYNYHIDYDEETNSTDVQFVFQFPHHKDKRKIESVSASFPSIAAYYSAPFTDIGELNYRYKHRGKERLADTFEDVIIALYEDPDSFSVDGYEEDYSAQEIKFLKAFQAHYLEAIRQYEAE